MTFVCHVVEISAEMQDLLSRCPGGFLGKVHSVFSSSCNIKTVHGRLLTLHNKNIPRTPLSLQCKEQVEFYNLSINAGDSVTYLKEYQGMQIGNVFFNMQEARLFSTKLKIEEIILPFSPYHQAVEKFMQEGEPNLYQSIRYANDLNKLGCVEKVLIEKITEAVGKMQQGFLEEDYSRILLGIKGLLGLGPGLTPSGDDLLLGYLTALSFKKHYCSMIENLKDDVLSLGKTQTTEISFEFIYYFFQHCYAQPIYSLIKSLNNNDLTGFRASLVQISAIGHSSGKDYLSGFGLGLGLL